MIDEKSQKREDRGAGVEVKVRIWDRRSVGEVRVQKVTGRATSGPDKYEGSKQSDQDGPGESDDGDEERVELGPKSHPLLCVTAASSVSRIPRIGVDVADAIG
jgi:hypothetical protein